MEREKAHFRQLVADTRTQRDRVRRLVAAKRWREAEPNRERLAQYTQRRLARTTPPGAEAIVGATDDMQPAVFLPEGAQIRRAVAYIEVSGPSSSTAGSGFLVSPLLILTNNHVIADSNAALGAQITFDREIDESGRPRRTTVFTLDPGRFSVFSAVDQLDYALIAVNPSSGSGSALDEYGYCVLSNRPDKHAIGMGVNIIQHPRGWPKMISVRNNILQYRTDRTLLYETDTEPGSSGSPVFNDTWELVALHHWGEPFLETKDENGNPIPTQINEGVRISAIYRDLEAKLETLPPEQRRLLEQVLAYDRQIVSVPAGGRQLSPPRPAPNPSESAIISPPGAIMTPLSGAQELRVTVPVEITVRVGTTPAAIPVGVQRIEPPPPAKVLTHAAEALQLDRDYSNRAGYDPRFILGLDLPLPQPNAALARQVAPLQQGEPNAARGELKYEHFSLKINKSKRIAVFTATNIDGATYLEVDRRTGQVSTGGSEGETWFKDPRISANFFLDQSFYSEWSDYFDRGHLTRRTDPTWGTSQQAERANADTFHFTNCSPQHFRFNQTTKYWQGAERYVLENGVLATDSPKRLCVFQGPVFDDRIDFWSGDVQIPSSFFKVIVWKSATGPKSVGLVVDQRSLLSETRRNLGQPQAVSAVDVSHWRLSITSIERRTGLDFGATVRDADTISHEGQPQVGEAQIMVKSFADLLPRAISG